MLKTKFLVVVLQKNRYNISALFQSYSRSSSRTLFQCRDI